MVNNKIINYQVMCRVISMPNATERRNNISKFLENMPFNWEFFDGLNSESDIGLSENSEAQLLKFGRNLGKNEIGCFKSHYALMQEFLNNSNSEWLLVLEDDVIIDTKFDFEALINLINKNNINYIRLFAKRIKPFKIHYWLSEYQIIRYLTDPYGTQAYFINKIGAKNFIDSINSIDRPIDDELGRFWKNQLYIYSVFPSPIIETFSPSQIASDRNIPKSKLPIKLIIGRQIYRIYEKVLKVISNIKVMVTN